MSFTRAAAAKQGNPDGLCGLYALINAVHDWPELDPDDQSERTREAFRYLTEAAERIGILTAHKLYDGYEWHELIEIFQRFASTHHYPYVAVPLRVVHDAMEGLSFVMLAKRVFEQGGRLVVSVDKGRHWVLAYEFDGTNVLVDDPSHDEPRTELQRPASKVDGLVIVPANSALAKLA